MKDKIQVVHVDDQPRQLSNVKAMLNRFNNVELVGQFTDCCKALDFILMKQVDLAILDVEMPGKNGLWLAEQIKETDTSVVFLTAFPDHSLKAFDACAIHYLLKPITIDELKNVIDRFYARKGYMVSGQNEQIAELINNYFNKTSYPKRIFVNNLHITTVVNLDDVLYMISSGSYTIIKLANGTKLTASRLLKTYSDVLLSHPDFLRIHRAHLVNKQHIKAVLRSMHKVSLLMSDGDQLEVSPQKREEIYRLIES
jgi:two-component system LytT family response regulator